MLSFKEFIQEATLVSLIDGTKQFQSETKAKTDRFIPQAAEGAIKIEKITPFFGTKIVIFSGNIDSFTDVHKYNTTIQFENVEFADEKLNPDYVLLEQYDKWMKRPHVSNNNCRCRCGCKDYINRFQHQNKKSKSLFGKEVKIIKKTDSPYLNDVGPGLCKHLINLGEALLENGYIDNK